MKYYTYFRTNENKLYKSTSILKFSDWADANNIKDWCVVQETFKNCEEV